MQKHRSRAPQMSMRAKLFIWMAAIATLQLTGMQAMSHPNCDVVRIAQDYVKTHFPFIDTAPDRHVVSLPIGVYWQVTFKLPDRYLGFVPEITVDPRTCKVVAAKVWQ